MEVDNLIEEVEIVEMVPQSIELPNKILFKIFDFFSIGNRRNCRLVCKQWLEVCNDPRLRKKEAFFFHASYKYPDIVKIITDSGRDPVNLKLRSYVLDDKSKCLWETCGSKINSLELSSCDFGAAILGQIIFSCPNMTELSVIGGSYNLGPSSFGPMFLCTKFKHPEEKTLRREKLEKLKFEATSMPIIHPDLERIHTYFPNLKNLSIDLCFEEPLEKKRDLLHFLALLGLVSHESSKVDSIYLNFEDGETYMFADLPVMKLKCMADYDLSKLKDVGMRFAQCTLNDESLNTILRYKFWTSLHITLHRIPPEKFDKFLIKLLAECPTLTSFGTYWKISKDSQFFAVFPAIVKSRLKSLSLEIDDRTLPDSQADSLEAKAKIQLKNLPKNETLVHLALDFAEACGFVSICIPHFPKVRQLKLKRGSLEDAFISLPDLLTLDGGDYSSYSVWSSRNQPITSVTKLVGMCVPIFTFESMSGIKFPDLKYLELTLSSDELYLMSKTGDFDDYAEDCDDAESFPVKIASILSSVAENAPNLRALSFDFGDLNDRYLKCETGNCSRDVLAAFFKSCPKLHQLRYVATQVECNKIEETFCKQHITDCYKEMPSLRAVYCVTTKQTIASFFNILENKVEFNDTVGRQKSSPNRVSVGFDIMDYCLESR